MSNLMINVFISIIHLNVLKIGRIKKVKNSSFLKIQNKIIELTLKNASKCMLITIIIMRNNSLGRVCILH